MNMKNYEEAMQLFEEAYKNNPLPLILKSEGELLLKQGNIDEALSKYEQALPDSVDDAELYAKIATLYLKLDDKDNAEKSFEKAINISPEYSSGILGLSSIYQFQGEYDKSFDLYKLSQNTNPNSAAVWNNIGLCFLSTGKNIYASTCLTKAFYLEPFTWGIAFNLGISLMQIGMYASAFVYMNTALKLKSDDYRIYMCLGIILGELNDPNNAVTYYNKALSYGENHLVLFNYTITLVKNEMYGQARSIYGRFRGCFTGNSNEENAEEINEIIPSLDSILNK